MADYDYDYDYDYESKEDDAKVDSKEDQPKEDQPKEESKEEKDSAHGLMTDVRLCFCFIFHCDLCLFISFCI